MKKIIRRRLCTLIIIALLAILVLNYMLQILTMQHYTERSSADLFWQMEQVISQNSQDLTATTNDIRNRCIYQAKTAAYVLKDHPERIESLREMIHIAEMLDVDEIHIFDSNGTLYAGTNPEYYGLNFNSGEQVSFFLPMLEDHELSLCQDITPNTASSKMMQYAATWIEDGSGIVQIGYEPNRVLEQTKRNDLSNIFLMFNADAGSTLLAVDPENHEILGSTDKDILKKNITDIGISEKQLQNLDDGFSATFNNVPSYCIFHEYDSIIIGHICTTDSLYRTINQSSIRLILYIAVIFGILIFTISKYLDKKIVNSIDTINSKLKLIANGNLDERVSVNTTAEFTELSGHINEMVASLLATTDQLSIVLDVTRMPIGVYEYNSGMDRVRYTRRVPQILNLSDEETRNLLSNYANFKKWLENLRSNPLPGEDGVFCLPGNNECYIKIESYKNDAHVFGILIDVTDDIQQKKQLELELGQDALTTLMSRRAFYKTLDTMFKNPDCLKNAAVIMIDSDDLKKINDNYGHDNGDRYLKKTGETLNSLKGTNQITARFGGDEFVIFIYGIDDFNILQSEIDKLYDLRENTYWKITDTNTIQIRFSIGTAFYPQDGSDYNDLLKYADSRMYNDKQQRKINRIEN